MEYTHVALMKNQIEWSQKGLSFSFKKFTTVHFSKIVVIVIIYLKTDREIDCQEPIKKANRVLPKSMNE